MDDIIFTVAPSVEINNGAKTSYGKKEKQKEDVRYYYIYNIFG